MSRLATLLWLSCSLAISLLARPVGAQESANAQLSFPVAGHAVSGRFAIAGTATSATFDRYELSFAYDPNPTNTWFYLAEPSRVPVVDGTLAEWDVSGITDGNYMLRLQVFSQDGTMLEAIVRGIIVQNKPPTPTAAPTATPELIGLATPTAEATPSPTALTGQLPTPATPAVGSGEADDGSNLVSGPVTFDKLGRAFWAGVRITLVTFLLLGAYLGVRKVYRLFLWPVLHQWWSELRK